MVSQQSKDIIAATLPAVRENAMKITSTFYPLMFERYPQVKAYFNENHQREGTQRQALANAVVAYAANLDRLEVLGDAVSLIVTAQAANGLLLPIIAVFLLYVMNRKALLGDSVNGRAANIAGGLVILITLMIGLRGIWRALSTVLGA